MKKIITLKINEDLKTEWEERAMENGLSLSDFIRQAVEGELNKEGVSKKDLEILEKKISIIGNRLEKRITKFEGNVEDAFKVFGKKLGKNIGETLLPINQRKEKRVEVSSSKKKVIKTNSKGIKWEQIEKPTNIKVIMEAMNPFFLPGDWVKIKEDKKIVEAEVVKFDNVSLLTLKDKHGKVFRFDIYYNNNYERLLEIWRRI
jgi:hypothetical protein